MSIIKFRRTNAGIANYAFFLNVDAVFYCEGEYGKNDFTKEGFLSPAFEDIDSSFWKPIASSSLPGKRIVIKSVGSKRNVLELVTAAARHELTSRTRSSFGCIDRDFNTEREVSDTISEVGQDVARELESRLLLTDGYSVENDLFSYHSTDEVLTLFAPRLPLTQRSDIKAGVAKLRHCLELIARIDRVVHYYGVEFINSDGLPSFVEKLSFPQDVLAGKIPGHFLYFRQNMLKKVGFRSYAAFKAAKPNIRAAAVDRTIDGFQDFRGKTLIKIVVNILNKVGKKLPKWGSLGEERVIDILLNEHSRLLEIDSYKSSSQRLLSWVEVVQGRRQLVASPDFVQEK